MKQQKKTWWKRMIAIICACALIIGSVQTELLGRAEGDERSDLIPGATGFTVEDAWTGDRIDSYTLVDSNDVTLIYDDIAAVETAAANDSTDNGEVEITVAVQAAGYTTETNKYTYSETEGTGTWEKTTVSLIPDVEISSARLSGYREITVTLAPTDWSGSNVVVRLSKDVNGSTVSEDKSYVPDSTQEGSYVFTGVEGTYFVSLVVTASDGTETTVKNSGSAISAIKDELSVDGQPNSWKEGVAVNLAASVKNGTETAAGYSFEWSIDGKVDADQTGETFVYIPSDGGRHTISLEATGREGSLTWSSGEFSADVLALVPKGTSWMVGKPGTITAEVSNGDACVTEGYIYQWYIDGEPVDSESGDTYEYTPADTRKHSISVEAKWSDASSGLKKEVSIIAAQGNPGDIGYKLSGNGNYYYSETAELTLITPENSEGSFELKVSKKNGTEYTQVGDTLELKNGTYNLNTGECGDYRISVTFTPDDDSYYSVSEDIDYSVVKLPITVTWTADENTDQEKCQKTYDGKTDLTISPKNIEVTVAKSVADRSVSAPELGTGTALQFVLDDKNAGNRTATLIVPDKETMYTVLGISDSCYELVDSEGKILNDIQVSVEVQPIPLNFIITADDKNYDMTTEVKNIKVSPESYEEVSGEIVKLSVNASMFSFSDKGSVSENRDVDLIYAGDYSKDNLSLTSSDSNVTITNYAINGVELVGATILCNTISDKDDLAAGMISYTLYTDRWIDDDFEITAKDDYQLTFTSPDNVEAEAFSESLSESLTGVKPDADNKVILYVKDTTNGLVYPLTMDNIKLDNDAPTIDYRALASDVIISEKDNVEYKVGVKDKGSGIANVWYLVSETLDADDNLNDWVEAASLDENGYAAFTVSVPAYGFLYVKAEDNVGNVYTTPAIRPLVLENNVPKIKVTIDGNGAAKDKYEQSHSVILTVSDGEEDTEGFSGVNAVSWELKDENNDIVRSGSISITGSPETLSDISRYREVTSGEILLCNQENQAKLDGKYTLVVTASDFCGNTSEESAALKFDTTAPTYEIEIPENTSTGEANVNTKEEETDEDGKTSVTNYHDGEVEVTYVVTESYSFDKTLVTLYVYKDGELVYQYPDMSDGAQFSPEGITASYDGGRNWVVGIDPEKAGSGVYTFAMSGSDGAGNKFGESDFTGAEQIVVLDITPPAYKVTLNPDDVYTDKDGFSETRYYNQDITAEIEVVDEYSFDDTLITLYVYRDGVQVLEYGNGMSITETGIEVDHTEGSQKWTVKISEATEEEGVYTFEMKGRDKAQPSDSEASLNLYSDPDSVTQKAVLDITPPSYTQSIEKKGYSTDDGEGQPVHVTNYYGKEYFEDSIIKAFFDITETGSYDATMISLFVYRDGSLLKRYRVDAMNQVIAEDGDWTGIEVSYGDTDGVKRWTVEIEAGAGDGDYTFDLEGTDKAENELILDGPEQVAVLDTTAPEIIGIEYLDADSGEALEERFRTYDDNGQDYINSAVVLKIMVDEHNLASSYAVNVTSNENNPLTELWDKEDTSDKATAVIDVPMYGEYGDLQTVELTIEDRAGNRAVLGSDEKGNPLELRSNVNTSFSEGTFTDKFVVDTVPPEITGIDYDTLASFLTADDGKDYVNEITKLTFTVNEHNLPLNSEGIITETGEEVDSQNPDDQELKVKWTMVGDVSEGEISVGQRGQGDPQTVKLTIVDRAGNPAKLAAPDEQTGKEGVGLRSAVYTSFDEEKGEFTDVFIVDTVPPVINAIDYSNLVNGAVSGTAEFLTDNQRDYIKNPVRLTFTVEEHNLTVASDAGVTSETTLESVGWELNGDIATTNIDVPMLGEYGDLQTINLTVKDRAGNPAILAKNDQTEEALVELRSKDNTEFADGRFTDRFTVDTVAPEITLSYRVSSPVAVDNGYFEVAAVDYFQSGVEVVVRVNEHNLNTNNVIIDVASTDEDGHTYSFDSWEKNVDIHSRVYMLNGDSQYDFTITGTDLAGNPIVLTQGDIGDVSVSQDSDNKRVTLSTAVDKNQPVVDGGDYSKPVIQIINPASTNKTDICDEHHPLYSSDVTYQVRVYDPIFDNYASGIEAITFTAKGASGVSGAVTVDKDGSVTPDEGDGRMTVTLVEGTAGSLAQGEENAYVFNVTLNSNVFNSNDIILTVDAVDVAMNELNSMEASAVSIDITSPAVQVIYDNNDVQNEEYFKADRVATIVVTDRNWSPDCLSIDTTGTVTGWGRSTGGGNGDETTWTGYVTFTAEQRHNLTVGVTDLAGNGQGGETVYNGAAPRSFILDKTKPVVSYVFDNNSVQNGIYYMAARMVTVSVVDENFGGENSIVIVSNGQNSGIAFAGLVAQYTFGSDGRYSFTGTVTDLAGNVSDPFTCDEFVIDLTAPEVSFEGIADKQAFGPNDEFKPEIIFSDTNYFDTGVEFELVRTGWEDDDDSMITGNYSELLYVLGQIEDNPSPNRSDLYQLSKVDAAVDGLYTLTLRVTDQAGNINGEGDTITFSVNRFGSVYVLDSESRAMVSRYYLREVSDIVIYEYNLNNATEESWIDIISNGIRTRLVKGVDYSVSGDDVEDDCNWKMRTYNIFAENFSVDGDYSIEIYVKDTVGNASTNNDPLAEGRGEKVSFIRDTIYPSVTLSGPEDGGIYSSKEMMLTVDYSDNIALWRLIITVEGENGENSRTWVYMVPQYDSDGNRVLPSADQLPDGVRPEDVMDLDAYSGQIQIPLEEQTYWQVIKAVVTDRAGNDTSIVDEEGVDHSIPTITFTLTTNPLIRWYNNKTAFYGTIGGALGIILLLFIILVLIKRRKDKRKEEKA